MARFNVAEYAVLGSLHRGDPRNFLQALQAIPRTLRTMYLHAWQVPLSLPLHFFSACPYTQQLLVSDWTHET